MIRRQPRRAAVALEAAIVYPVVFLLLMLLILGGIGVFRYQQVALLAHEGARYASVHGEQWARTTDRRSPTEAEIRDQAVLPLVTGLDPKDITVHVEWVDQSSGAVMDWDDSSKAPTSKTSSGDDVTNRVRVTVTYRWTPWLFVKVPVDMKSVAEVPMSY